MRNAFAASAHCGPSRAALISGLYPSETGVTGNIGTGNVVGLDTNLILWPELLQHTGYRTALVGKWHLGGRTKSYYPEDRGYDRFSGFLGLGRKSRDPDVRVEGRDTCFEDAYTPDVLTDLAMDYIRDFGDGPWAISLHYWAPHANTGFPRGFRPKARGRSWLPLKEEDLDYWKDLELVLPDPDFPNLDIELLERMMREYYASVHSVDRNVGRLMDFLESMGLDRKTIVIFTSDHGYMMGHHGMWHKGSGRWVTIDQRDPSGIYSEGIRSNLYDLSLRVPCIIRWPGVVEPGSFVEETITFLDMYPTLLEMAGADKPDNLLIRGKSFVPLLKGKAPEWDNTFYAHFGSLRCVQTPEWKYVHAFSDTTKNELYNLAKDPGEIENLIHSSDPAVKNKILELRGLLFTKLREIGDYILD
jgi:uncharacterized sulfatase